MLIDRDCIGWCELNGGNGCIESFANEVVCLQGIACFRVTSVVDKGRWPMVGVWFHDSQVKREGGLQYSCES
jgi:hypothetical protein